MPADGNPASRITHYQALGINCLITRNGGQFFASFNDGLTEEFTPPDGKPRPTPDLATKTKHQKVPWSYQQMPSTEFFYYKTCLYTGTMRLMVGAYTGKGVDAPVMSDLRYKSHGIFKATVPVTTAGVTELVEKFWIIEISRNGVFSAPVTPGSWSVAHYLEIPNGSYLDLSWAITNKPGLGVVELMNAASMVPVYETVGNYKVSSQTWAFSYSGAQAQIVGWKETTSPALHYKTSRWKLTFQLIGTAWPNVNPSANLQMLEINKILGMWDYNGIYGPWGAGAPTEGTRPYLGNKWLYINYYVPNHPTIHFPDQDAPVFVYYDGEEEILVRWKAVRTDIPADPPIPPHYPGYQAHVFVDAGFYCTGKFNHVRTTNTIKDYTGVPGPAFHNMSSLVIFEEREAFIATHHQIRAEVVPFVSLGPYSAVGESVLCMAGGHLVKEDMTFHPVTPGPGGSVGWPEADNQNLGDFIDIDATGMVDSNVEAVHGSLYYDDPTLKPPNQKMNAIYRLGGAVISVGGFNRPPGSYTIAFVGKA